MSADFFKIYDQKKSAMIKQFRERLNKQAIVIRKAVESENDKKVSELERTSEELEIYKKETHRLEYELKRIKKGTIADDSDNLSIEIEHLQTEITTIKKDIQKKDRKISLLETNANKYIGLKNKILGSHMTFGLSMYNKIKYAFKDFL
jgi:hypothetical protein